MTALVQHTRTEKLLLEAARTFNSTLEYEELIELVLQLVMAAVGSEAALVFRIDHNRTDMRIRFMKSPDFVMKIFHRELGQGVVGWVAQYREPIIINDPAKDPRVDTEIEKLGDVKFRSLISVPLVGKGQMIGVVGAINKIRGEFGPQDLDILAGLNNQIAVAIDNAYLYREVRREALEKDLLYEVGKKLSSSLDLDELLGGILSSLKRVVDFDAGGVFLIDEQTSNIRSISTVGYDACDPAKLRLKIGEGLVGHVAKTGQPVNVTDVSTDDRYIDCVTTTKSEIVVPIKLNDRMIGVLNLESNDLNAYDHRSLALVDAFASQAAISLERTRSHRSMLESRKLEEQLNVARAIQRSFLPKSNPVIPGYDISGTNIASGQVGGDYYDFIGIVDGHIGIAIGDVSGKGIPAALIMASFRASLIAEIRNNYSVRTICSKVNSLLCESVDPGNYVSAVYGVLDCRNHILTFVNCGHCLPVIIKEDGEVEYLREGGPLLGVTTSGVYEDRALLLGPGDIGVFYTDGVTEVFNDAGEEFGLERLVAVLKEHRQKTAVQVQEAIYSAVRAFAAPDHVFDDLTMIIFKRLAN